MRFVLEQGMTGLGTVVSYISEGASLRRVADASGREWDLSREVNDHFHAVRKESIFLM